MWGFFFSNRNFILFDRNNSRLGNGVLYASVNPEYFSAADGKLLNYSHCLGSQLRSFGECYKFRGRGFHYFEGPLASDPSSLTLFFKPMF